MKMEQDWVDQEFDRIVEFNYFYEDILVPVLADNSLIRHVLMTLPFVAESEADEENCKAELEKLLSAQYNLPTELSEDVFELCEEKLKFSHECERWIEADGEA